MKVLKKIAKRNIREILPYILIIGGIFGLFVSLSLSIEHIDLLKNPEHRLSCSLDPVLACGPVITSDQATAFGFPNPLVGLVAFGAQTMLGFAMLAGARMKSWFWKLYGVVIIGGLAFNLWLIFQTVYRINALCIYCIGAWIVVFTTAWYVFQFMLAEKHIKLGNKKLTAFIRKHHFDILLVWFLLIAGLILNHFWYYYGPKLGF